MQLTLRKQQTSKTFWFGYVVIAFHCEYTYKHQTPLREHYVCFFFLVYLKLLKKIHEQTNCPKDYIVYTTHPSIRAFCKTVHFFSILLPGKNVDRKSVV